MHCLGKFSVNNVIIKVASFMLQALFSVSLVEHHVILNLCTVSFLCDYGSAATGLDVN